MIENRRVIVWELCGMIPDVSKTTIDKIFTKKLSYQVGPQVGPKMLTEDHKQQRVEAAREILECYDIYGEEFLD